MRRYFLFLFVLMIFIGSCQQKKEAKSRKTKAIPEYSIGVNLPLTGNGSYFAEEFRKGMDLAFDHYTDSAGKMILNILYEDNKFNPRDAITISRKFIDVNEVEMVLVGYTPMIQATANVLEQAEMPTLYTICSAEDIARPCKWAFRDFELESYNMRLMAGFAFRELGLKKGSWLVVNDDMGADAARFFTESFESHGGKILNGEVFESSELDLRNKISKLRDDDPDFIVVVGRGSAMINACRQIREQDLTIPIIGTVSIDNQLVWDALGSNGDNIYFPALKIDTQSKRYLRTSERFEERYGHKMNWLNIYGISTANYLVKALRKSEGDKEALREFLATLDVNSLRGRVRMNENRDVIVDHLVHMRKNGESVPASGLAQQKD